MDTLVTGIHHITLCPGSAQADVDFFTGVLGQRLVKQTVLLDGNIPVYHFYYGNADAEPGSIATVLSLSPPQGPAGLGAGVDAHLRRAQGLAAVLGRAPGAARRARRRHRRAVRRRVRPRAPSRGTDVRADGGRRPRRPVDDLHDRRRRGDARFPRRRVVGARGGRGGTVLRRRPGLPQGRRGRRLPSPGAARRRPGRPRRPAPPARSCAGQLDVSARAPSTTSPSGSRTTSSSASQKALYEELGYTDASEVKDRYYFHSMYVRAPGGILVECTANVDEGLLHRRDARGVGHPPEPSARGTKTSGPPSCRCSKTSSCRRPTGRARPRRQARPAPRRGPCPRR